MLQFHDIIIKDTFHRLESRGEKWLHHSTFGMTHKEEQGENDQFILRLLLEQTPLLTASTTAMPDSSLVMWQMCVYPIWVIIGAFIETLRHALPTKQLNSLYYRTPPDTYRKLCPLVRFIWDF